MAEVKLEAVVMCIISGMKNYSLILARNFSVNLQFHM